MGFFGLSHVAAGWGLGLGLTGGVVCIAVALTQIESPAGKYGLAMFVLCLMCFIAAGNGHILNQPLIKGNVLLSTAAANGLLIGWTITSVVAGAVIAKIMSSGKPENTQTQSEGTHKKPDDTT